MATTASARPIIVVGCPRSGTTLLQVMLHTHPRIAIPPENRFVLPAYSRRREFGDLGKEANRRKLGKWITRRSKTKFGDFGLDADEVIARIAAAPPTLGSALSTIFQAYADRFGKARWGDKRPMYALHLDVIRRLYPDAQIVSIVRDGRDCIASLKEMSWYQHDLHYAISSWALSVDATRRAARRLGPDSFYEIGYEQLVHDPEPQLRALCDFLGEDYHAAMADPAETAAVAVPERKKHHALTHQPVTEQRVESWRERLTPEEIAVCESLLGSRLRRYGYELSGAGRAGLSPRARVHVIKTRRRARDASRAVADNLRRLTGEAPVAAATAEPATDSPADRA